jgi:hypothetical protein
MAVELITVRIVYPYDNINNNIPARTIHRADNGKNNNNNVSITAENRRLIVNMARGFRTIAYKTHSTLLKIII